MIRHPSTAIQNSIWPFVNGLPRTGSLGWVVSFGRRTTGLSQGSQVRLHPSGVLRLVLCILPAMCVCEDERVWMSDATAWALLLCRL